MPFRKSVKVPIEDALIRQLMCWSKWTSQHHPGSFERANALGSYESAKQMLRAAMEESRGEHAPGPDEESKG